MFRLVPVIVNEFGPAVVLIHTFPKAVRALVDTPGVLELVATVISLELAEETPPATARTT